MKYALISLSDKEGMIPFASELINAGYHLLATGGTAQLLTKNNLEVTLIEDMTGFPEILNGRVKTLHPKIFGGILADRDNKDHLLQLDNLLINLIDIVVVNLYPFQKLFRDMGNHQPVSHEEMIENIDIGGVTLLRAAAKNYRYISVLSDKEDYDSFLQELRDKGKISNDTRLYLANKAFAATSGYDRYINIYLQQLYSSDKSDLFFFPDWHKTELRYGENPHQKGVFLSPDRGNLINQIHGKQLSYNNYLDINAALKLIYRFNKPTVAILKHTNPCGVASGNEQLTAYKNAFKTDPLSPYGGIVITNQKLNLETSREINNIFTEIIISPGFSDEVYDFLSRKKNRRLISYNSDLLANWSQSETFVSCLDGILSQNIDLMHDNEENWKVVTEKNPSEEEYDSLRFCWYVVAALKSNAICLGKEERTLGLGMGQTSRIDSAELAAYRAKKFGHDLKDAVCASDGFFPFRDGVDYLAAKGIRAIIQPGGSKCDEEVIKACNELGVSMIFTGTRHFAH